MMAPKNALNRPSENALARSQRQGQQSPVASPAHGRAVEGGPQSRSREDKVGGCRLTSTSEALQRRPMPFPGISIEVNKGHASVGCRHDPPTLDRSFCLLVLQVKMLWGAKRDSATVSVNQPDEVNANVVFGHNRWDAAGFTK